MTTDHSCSKEVEIAIIHKGVNDGAEAIKKLLDKNDIEHKEILRTLRGYNGNPGIVGLLYTARKNQRWLWASISAIGTAMIVLAGWIHYGTKG